MNQKNIYLASRAQNKQFIPLCIPKQDMKFIYFFIYTDFIPFINNCSASFLRRIAYLQIKRYTLDLPSNQNVAHCLVYDKKNSIITSTYVKKDKLMENLFSEESLHFHSRINISVRSCSYLAIIVLSFFFYKKPLSFLTCSAFNGCDLNAEYKKYIEFVVGFN